MFSRIVPFSILLSLPQWLSLPLQTQSLTPVVFLCCHIGSLPVGRWGTQPSSGGTCSTIHCPWCLSFRGASASWAGDPPRSSSSIPSSKSTAPTSSSLPPWEVGGNLGSILTWVVGWWRHWAAPTKHLGGWLVAWSQDASPPAEACPIVRWWEHPWSRNSLCKWIHSVMCVHSASVLRVHWCSSDNSVCVLVCVKINMLHLAAKPVCHSCSSVLHLTTECVIPLLFLSRMNPNSGGKASFLAGTGGISNSSRKREFKELGRECVQPERPVLNT